MKTMPPPFTTERFYMDHAGQHGAEALARHLNRYEWAKTKIAEGDRVLDAGCGSGYGDFVLLTKASSVVGVDQSDEAIAYACIAAEQKSELRLRYYVQNLDSLRSDNVGVFDSVVCIEVIEHMARTAQFNFINGLRQIMRTGRLIITTPRKSLSGPKTEHHVHEMTAGEFIGLLFSVFKSVELTNPAVFGIPSEFLLATCRGFRS